MVFFTDNEIDSMIEEDVPYIDLTSNILGLDKMKGTITYTARENLTVSGTEISARIMEKLKLDTISYIPSGTICEKGTILMSASGSAYDLHRAWKICVNLLEHMSGITTKTRQFIEKVHLVNQNINVVTTRKSMPGNKKAVIAAIMAGGALPHRLGLSETILIFDEHYKFFGGLRNFCKIFPSFKKDMQEKKIAIEVKNSEDALLCAESGFDIIQIDKMPANILSITTKQIKKINPYCKIAATGGINLHNAEEYAAAGVDILVLSSLYHAGPADIGVCITRL